VKDPGDWLPGRAGGCNQRGDFLQCGCMTLYRHRAGGGELVLYVDHDQRFHRIPFHPGRFDALC